MGALEAGDWQRLWGSLQGGSGDSGGHGGSGSAGGHSGTGDSGGHGGSGNLALIFSGGQGGSGSSAALALGLATQAEDIWPPQKKFLGKFPSGGCSGGAGA